MEKIIFGTLENIFFFNFFLNLIQDGLLSNLPNLQTINISRNDFTAFPQGGPAQFAASVVSNVCRIF